MSNSPILSAEGPVECVIESGGKALSSILPIVSVDVYYGINSIPKAVIVIEDGEMSNGSFPLSDGEELAPGSEVTIKAGYETKSTPIFKGIVLRHGISIDKSGRCCVKIECRHKAIAMTCARKNANFLDKFKENPKVKNAFYGLRPASIAMITAAGINVALIALFNVDAFKASGNILSLFQWKALIMAVLLYYAMKKSRLHPIAFIVISALAGILFQF